MAYRFGLSNSKAAFRFACVMTRPFGALVADWPDAGTFRGGLRPGTLPVSIVSINLLIAFVIRRGYACPDVLADREETQKGVAADVKSERA